ncbi:MAG: MBL fold metallo-hydrolase [Spirochaetales bacterium]|nr:MBL fold metallo-hydrolase [Spirochaetales bacterium]
MTITVLTENTPHPQNKNLQSAHGLALAIQTKKTSLLYDVGPSGTLQNNASELKIPLDSIEAAILSHGHDDHAGDLEHFGLINKCATIYMGKGATAERWSIKSGSPRSIGIPSLHKTVSTRMVTVFEDLKAPNFTILTAAPGQQSRPAGNQTLLMGAQGNRMPDEFLDELTLVLEGEQGLVVLTGCSHRGILNIIDQVQSYFSSKKVSMVVGGFHLRDGEDHPEKMQHIAQELAQKLPLAQIYGGHCTGEEGKKALHQAFRNRFTPLHVGQVIET